MLKNIVCVFLLLIATAATSTVNGEKIHDAARDNDLETLHQEIDSGVYVDTLNEDGDTPLMCAVKSGHFHMVETLLELGADAYYENERSTEESTAFLIAIKNGYDGISNLLSQHVTQQSKRFSHTKSAKNRAQNY